MLFRKLIFLLLLFVLLSCSSVEQQKIYTPIGFEIIREISTKFVPDKCLYSFANKTVFARQQDNSEIHIFKDGKKINTIGGIGFDQMNFTKLSDIALAPDGSLLALDSFEKTIKKFDVEGKFITSIELTDFSQPTLFTIASDETFYIYDSDRNEISNYARLNEYDTFAFGRFQLTAPTNLQLAGNLLVVNENSLNKTLIFDTFGQLEEELNGYYQIEKRQKYLLLPNYLLHEGTGEKFAVSIPRWKFFSQQDGYTILASKDKILIGKFIYEIR
ncbi:MAG: hypothetical protein Q7J16_05180 [Candidatus Cloacimonadales bacterium]|nr:hypothetical protein [Candidatus Cloacimonadales bacterium]